MSGLDEVVHWINKLISECGEFGQIAGNAGCFGIDTPDRGRTARERIESELADIDAVTRLAIRAGVVSGSSIDRQSKAKQRKLLDPSQRDNLGRPLAPPMPDDVGGLADLAAVPTGSSHERKPPSPRSNDEANEGPGTQQIAVSARVKAELDRLLEVGSVDLDTILRRALRIETETEIPQDGTIGYRDPDTGLVLPEGLPIERTYKGITYRAHATAGGFEDEAGRRFENLNQLNKTLPTGRPENAWNEWWFAEAGGRLRRLNAARPTARPRQRKSGRRGRMVEA